jgi:hypothetical protein
MTCRRASRQRMARRVERIGLRYPLRSLHHGAMKRLSQFSILLGALWTGLALCAEPRVLYVATDGRDDWSGRLAMPNADRTDGPLATVHRARDLMREWRRAEPVDPNAPAPVVRVRGGHYRLSEPLILTPADSGLMWQAHGTERPVLSGGERIRDWTIDESGRWHADLPAVREGRWHFTQLFVNDQRRWRPRLPERGYHAIAGELERSADAQAPGVDRFQFAGADIRGDWSNLNDVEVLAFHSWSMSRLPIRSVNSETSIVSFFGGSPSLSWWGLFRKGNRYLVENVKEALRQPGQWYLDRPTGRLTYLPKPGESPEQTVVIAPRLEQLLVLRGEPDDPVRDVWIEGLTFAHGAWQITPSGQVMPQAEINLDGAISATHTRGLVLRRCAVRHVGVYAIALGDGCHDNVIESCELVDLGAGGVKLGATRLDSWGGLRDAARSAEPTTSRNTVRDTTIAYGGRLHPAAIGVWIGHSPYNTIEHNEIYDLYYSATSIGWIWGYSRSHAHHNRVLYNHLHTLGQGVLSDMGAVYTLGVSPGTVVSYNRIHDVDAFDYGGWGLYTDEGSTGVRMENNLVYRTKTGGFHQHYGRENQILNNILAFARTDQVQRTRVEDHRSFTFERNIVLYDQGHLLGMRWGDDKTVLDRNLYWRRNGQVRFPGDRAIEAWRESTGHDRNSIVADPMFLDPDRDDYRLADGSPAIELGFVPFDWTKAGRITARTLTVDLPPVPAAFE